MIFSDDRESALTRAVLVSLFTWRRALTDDPVDDEELFGWWGDSYPDIADDRIGSRLWLLRRVKLTDATQRDAEFYANEALRWLLDDGHAIAIEITSEKVDISRLNLTVILTVHGGDRIEIKPISSWQVIYAV
ncbi:MULTISPECIES: phage GP46 family protein [unclassified Pseudomonas]|uniref:phage GP46 family protein n=1 Tax=unclassified Pseudomonas TaxID=196821 RepID=UPI00215CC88D|nr:MULTISPECIES: phage GP46 family protein [unclassified Pseudomonas]MCR8931923.1 phage GP46 family protein [Pseudomonas sp. S11A4]MCR8975533.1 phage GP46 family protein [Pseudomonas sp. S11P7]